MIALKRLGFCRKNLKVIIVVIGCFLIAALLLSGCKWQSRLEAEVNAQNKTGYIVTNVEYAGFSQHHWGHGDLYPYSYLPILAKVTYKVDDQTITIIETILIPIPYCNHYDIKTDDPVLLQVPSDWYDFAGTYAGPSGSGSLIIKEGSFASDDTGTLYTPEPGYKLIMISAPDYAADGTYTIRLGWRYTESGIRTVKGIAVGYVSLSNTISGESRMYLPPIAPKTTKFSGVKDPPFVWTFPLMPLPSWVTTGKNAYWLATLATFAMLAGIGIFVVRKRKVFKA